MRIYVIMAFVLFTMVNTSYAKEVPFTLEDRDRLIRVEEGLKAVNQRIDTIEKQMDNLEKRMDNLLSAMLGGFGVLFSGMVALVGFILWDRRSTLAPVVRKNKELEEDLLFTQRRTRDLEEREAILEKALREYAEQDSRLKEILRGVRLL